MQVSWNPLRLLTNPAHLLAYLTGSGPLASVSGFEGVAIYRTGLDPSTAWPDVQLNMISVTPGIDSGLVYKHSLNMDDRTFAKWRPLTKREGFNIVPLILHPRR